MGRRGSFHRCDVCIIAEVGREAAAVDAGGDGGGDGADADGDDGDGGAGGSGPGSRPKEWRPAVGGARVRSRSRSFPPLRRLVHLARDSSSATGHRLDAVAVLTAIIFASPVSDLCCFLDLKFLFLNF